MAASNKFTHLHLHSEYSLLDGACRFDRLTKRVKELGMNSVALTDHGNLFGALQFARACKADGIKPILGCETYISPTTRHDRKSRDARRNQHFVLLAETQEGWTNLQRLVSLGYMEGFYYKPRIDKEILAEHSKGLIGLSACVKGVVSDYLREDDFAGAEKSLDDYVQILGRENFYMELMDHGLDFQKKVNDGILDLAKRHDLPLVGTNDCHYLTSEDHTLHDVLLCIQMGKTLSDENRMRMEDNEFYMKTPEQMISLFGHLGGAIENTLEVAERCNAEIQLGQKLLPSFIPPDNKDEEPYLREITLEGMHHRYGSELTAEQKERMNFELKIIHQMGFDSYFLIVWDFIHYAHSQKIPVGPGRGSGAGSIVAYALGITNLCPLEHGLFFERFLNPERVSMPDFDIDFCYERRGEVIEYVRQKYGERNVAQIITFSKMKAKAALHDVGRVMGISLPDVDRVSKLVPDGPKVTLKKALEESQELRELIDADAELNELVENAKGLEGTVRHSSVHAAGVVICDRDLTRLIPLYRPPNTNDLVTQWTMTEVEDLGLLKMDFLGLKTLTFIDKTIKEVKRNRGIEIDWDEIPITDAPTYKLLQSGEALGLFQLESQGMRELLKQLRPENFAEVVALISLYRPGPMENIPEFIARKHGRKEIEYDHPLLEPILKETYGLIVYQEQVMQIAQVLGGFTLGGADMLRRAMGKKKADVMAAMQKDFVDGCAKNDVSQSEAEHLFNLIEKFAGYGFNKSHSAAYTMVTFQTAYLKAHYPVEFYAQLLTSEIGGNDAKMATYMTEAAARGFEVLPPDINESRKMFAVAGKHIRFGLLAIKNVGDGPVTALLEERDANGHYSSIQDFISRMPPRSVNARTVECMIKCGVFDRFGHNRPSLEKALPKVMEFAGASRREEESAQTSMFDMMSDEEVSSMNGELKIEFVKDWSEAHKLEIEKSLAGYYLSGHPLKRFAQDFEKFASCKSSDLKSLDDRQDVTWIGMIQSVNVRQQKDGRPFALVTAEDMFGAVDLTIFADAFAGARSMIVEGKVVWIKGSVNRWNDRISLRVNEIKSTDDIRKKMIRGLDLTLPATSVCEANLTMLRDILSKHRGSVPVRMQLTCEEGDLLIQAGKPFRVRPGDELIVALQDAKIIDAIHYATNGK